MRFASGALLGWALGMIAGPAAALPGCDAFLAKLRSEGADIGVEYSRALVVSRVHSNAQSFDVQTRADVDGTLTCQGDEFVRFEVHALEPLKGRAGEGFERLQVVAMKAALGWDAGKAKSESKGLAGEARDYLSASRQRGDVYVAGKTERHQPGGVGIGMIFSDIDRTFIIVREE